MISVVLIRMFVFRHARLAGVVAIAAGLLCFFLTVLFPGMPLDEAGTVSASWPPLLRQLFGDPLLGFSDVHAWLHLQIFNITFWVVLGALAAILASGIIAGETERKTMDILLSCPMSRGSILASQLAAILLLLAVAVLPAIAGCTAGILALGNEVRLGALFTASAEGVLLSFSIAAATLLISVFIPSQTISASMALAAFGMLFFLDAVVTKVVPALNSCRFLNPFHFYDADGLLIRHVPQITNLIVLTAISLALAAAAVAAFARRDIRC